MLFDVIELGARLEGIVVPVQLPHPTVENETVKHPRKMEDTSQVNVRVPVTDVTQVAFEVAYVHGIKAGLKRSSKLQNGRLKTNARW